MKIALVSDYNADEYLGGCELILRRLINIWKDEKDVEVNFYTAPKFKKEEGKEYSELDIKTQLDLLKTEQTRVVTDEILKNKDRKSVV